MVEISPAINYYTCSGRESAILIITVSSNRLTNIGVKEKKRIVCLYIKFLIQREP